MQTKVRQTILTTPRPYLSYSQLSVFERSQDSYIDIYINGNTYSNPRMDYGKRVHQSLETGLTSQEKSIQHAYTFLPRYGRPEAKIKVKTGDLTLYGILDDLNVRKSIINEYKTGAIIWTQSRVNKDVQLTFYVLLFFLKYKRLPKIIYLNWLNTNQNSKDYLNITQFETHRTLTDIIRMDNRTKKVWQGIIKHCESI